MRRLGPTRVIGVVALIAAGSLTTGAMASTAGASAAAPARCSTLVATLKGVGTVTNCTDAANTGGSGKIVFNITKLTDVVTWNKTGTTTLKIAYSAPKVDEPETPAHSCAKGTTELLITGAVTGGTGAAIKSIPKGSKVSAEICEKTNVTLELGSTFTF
jgi:hypothetical protein